MATPSTSGYSPSATGGVQWTPQDDHVDTQVQRITAANSPLMQQARAQGQAGMARRGLLNSSMAVGAGQQAVLNTALPMAQQNAAQIAQKNLSAQQYGENRGLADQKFGFDTKLADQAYQNQRGLNEQQFGFNTRLSDQSYQQQRGLNDQQFGYNTQLNQQKFGYDTQLADQAYGNQRGLNDQQYNNTLALQNKKFEQDWGMLGAQTDAQVRLSDLDYQQKMQLARLDNASKERIAQLNTAAYDREKAMSALAAMEQSYASVFNGIGGNASLPAEARNAYLSHIAAIRDSTLSLVEQMYGVDITWASPGSPSVNQ